MAANKVVYGTLVLMDLTKDTVTADQMPQGCTAHDKSGNQIAGTADTSDIFQEASKISLNGDNVMMLYNTKNTHFVNENKAIKLTSDKSNFGNATVADVVKGKTFTSSAGLKAVGTLSEGTPTTSYDNTREMSWRQIDSSIVGKIQVIDIPVKVNAGESSIIISGSTETVISPAAVNFGNATAADVAKGKTFTSINGVKLTGTASSSGGIDTSDATATASDLPYGVTAYAKGTKITGSINQIKSGSSNLLTDLTPSVSNNNLRLNYQRDKDIIMRSGSWQIIDCALSNLGDATAADVAKGKTFTSSAGLKVTGTASTGSGGTTAQNAVFGSVTPESDGSCTINTGLPSVSKFTLAYDGEALTTTAGCYAVYYSNGATHGLGWTKGAYNFNMTVSSAAPNVSISGGTITIAAGTAETKLAAHAYMWSASV